MPNYLMLQGTLGKQSARVEKLAKELEAALAAAVKSEEALQVCPLGLLGLLGVLGMLGVLPPTPSRPAGGLLAWWSSQRRAGEQLKSWEHCALLLQGGLLSIQRAVS